MPTDDEHIPPEYRGVGGKKPATPRTEPLPLPNAVHDQTTKVFRGGISASAYGDHGAVIDEAWFSWDEVEERKGNGSDITFDL